MAKTTTSIAGKSVSVPLEGPDVLELIEYRTKQGLLSGSIPGEGPAVAELFRRGLADWKREGRGKAS